MKDIFLYLDKYEDGSITLEYFVSKLRSSSCGYDQAVTYCRGELRTRLDENFEPESVPALNIVTPQDVGLPSGVSAKAIEDQALREQYQHNISDNQRELTLYNKQVRLHRLSNYINNPFN